MATAQADADNAAASLSPFLIDVGAGPSRRRLPGRPGVEFIASLPGKVGRRVPRMVDSAVGVDNYVVARAADHLCSWQNCYRSTQLLGGDSRFVLSANGHSAAIVNPPGNPKASYRVGDEKLTDAGQWMRTSSTQRGSWWGRLRRLAHRARRSAEAEPSRTRHYRAGSAGRRARHQYLRELIFH